LRSRVSWMCHERRLVYAGPTKPLKPGKETAPVAGGRFLREE
jgi:hypothetical protein